jgi:hypothetical protein
MKRFQTRAGNEVRIYTTCGVHPTYPIVGDIVKKGGPNNRVTYELWRWSRDGYPPYCNQKNISDYDLVYTDTPRCSKCGHELENAYAVRQNAGINDVRDALGV